MRRVTALLLLLLVAACDGNESAPPTLPPRVTATPSSQGSQEPSPTVAAASPTVSAVASPAASQPTPNDNLPLKPPTPATAVDTPTLPNFTAPISLTVAGLPVLEADATPSNKLIAVTRKGLYRRVAGNDDGDPMKWQWQLVSNRTPLPNLLAVDDETILAGDTPKCGAGNATGVPLIVSTDGGATWANASSDAPSPLYARPVEANGDDLFAVSCGGVFRSTDNATSWQRQNDLVADNEIVTDLALTFDGETMYFTAAGEGGNSTIYRSDRNVSRWTAPLQLVSTWAAGFVRIGPPDQSLYYGSPLGLYYRAAGGADWVLITDGLQRTTVGGDPRAGYRLNVSEQNAGMFDLLPNSDSLLLATSDGIYAAVPGGTWSRLALANTATYQMFYGPGGLYTRTAAGVLLLRNMRNQ